MLIIRSVEVPGFLFPVSGSVALATGNGVLLIAWHVFVEVNNVLICDLAFQIANESLLITCRCILQRKTVIHFSFTSPGRNRKFYPGLFSEPNIEFLFLFEVDAHSFADERYHEANCVAILWRTFLSYYRLWIGVGRVNDGDSAGRSGRNDRCILRD